VITADGSVSNGSRVKLFKLELQNLAAETGLTLQVCHYQPGTSKRKKIEHRLFRYITQIWCGTPLTSRLAGMAATTTKTGLKVRFELDTRLHPKAINVGYDEMSGRNITEDRFHLEWNDAISPRLPP